MGICACVTKGKNRTSRDEVLEMHRSVRDTLDPMPRPPPEAVAGTTDPVLVTKVVLVSIGQRNKKVSFIGSKKKDLYGPIQEKFIDIFQNGQEISHLQLWSNDFQEYVDLEEEDEIANSTKIRAVLKVTIRIRPLQIEFLFPVHRPPIFSKVI